MADFLDEKRKEIQARLKELKPYVEEYELLQAADSALSGIGNGASSTPRAASRQRHPRAAAPSARPAVAAAPGAGAPRAAERAPRRRWTS